METTENEAARLRRGQILTLVLLTLGYTCYYFCRANFSVSKPDIIEELAAGGGITKSAAKEAIGAVASYGTFAYAVGKVISGSLADRLGGRRTFLAGMGGAILFTIVFVLGGGLPIFTLAWIGNRAVQSLGFPSMIKVSSRWFPYTNYGFAASVLALSYLFGDAAARGVYGQLINFGLTWRQLFWAGAGFLTLMFTLCALLLREAPPGAEPETNPTSVYGEKAREASAESLGAILKPLFTSPAFLIVCVLSFCLTLVRDTFGEWSPTYFVEYLKLHKDVAASRSALFPLFGGMGVLLAGVLSDRLGRNGRAAILLGGMILATGALLGLGFAPPVPTLVVSLVALVAFLMLGPYSYLSGALSLDFGGRRGGATASGIIDGVGYLGGALAGQQAAQLSNHYGWSGVFRVLATVMALGCIAATAFLINQRRLSARISAADA